MIKYLRHLAKLAIILCFLGVGARTDAAEAGDTCATAGTITQSGEYPFDTTGASGNDPCTFGNPGYSAVWFELTPLQSGYAILSTCDASFTTHVAAYKGGSCPQDCGDLITSRDAPCGLGSEVILPVTANVSHPIVVRGFTPSAAGPGVLSVTFVESNPGAPVAAGFDCETAGELMGDSVNPFDLTGADLDPCSAVQRQVLFYKFTAPTEGYIFADLCDSNFYSFLQVFKTDSCVNVCSTSVRFDTRSCDSDKPFVSLNAISGETYYFMIGGATASETGTGNFVFTFEPIDLGLGDEAGPRCETAGIIDGPGLYEFDTTNAPADDACRGGRASVWYQFTPQEDGYLQLATCGSSFDTYLQVTEGASCPGSCADVTYQNDDSCGSQSELEFFATAGQTYFIGIQGFNLADRGPGVLSVAFSQEIVQAGDTCETAGMITVNSVLPFDTTGASANEPCFLTSPTVFYKYTAPQAGRVYAEILEADFRSYMFAYLENGCTLSCESYDDIVAIGEPPSGPGQPRITFLAEPGETYLLAVAGLFPSQFGEGVLAFTFDPTDDGTSQTGGLTCADPEIVGEGSYAFDSTFAPKNDPCAGPTRSVLWYEYTAPGNGRVLLETCSSYINTALLAYPGGTCPTSCDNIIAADFGACGDQAALSLDVSPGASILLAVVAEDENNPGGPGVLNIKFIPDSEVLTGTPVAAGINCSTAGVLNDNSSNPFNTTGGVDWEACAVLFDYPDNNPKAFFQYTATRDGLINVDLCGSEIDTAMTIYKSTPCQFTCPLLYGSSTDGYCDDQAGAIVYAHAGETFTFVIQGTAPGEVGNGILNLRFYPDDVATSEWDINGDGITNVADVTALANLIAGGNAPDLEVGDVNNDGVVNELDVQALAELIAD